MAGITGKLKTAGKVVGGLMGDARKAATGEGMSITGRTIKEAAGRMFNKDTVRDVIKPGLSSAFQEAGGKSGLAKRVIGGAAVGGTATGTIGALRGNDFWESARSGAVMGAGHGAYKQGRAMYGTESGQGLITTAKGELDTSKGIAASEFSRDNISKVKNPTGRQILATNNSVLTNLQDDYLGGVRAPKGNLPGGSPSAHAPRGARSASPNYSYQRKARNPMVSKAVHTLEGQAKRQKMSDSVVNATR